MAAAPKHTAKAARKKAADELLDLSEEEDMATVDSDENDNDNDNDDIEGPPGNGVAGPANNDVIPDEGNGANDGASTSSGEDG